MAFEAAPIEQIIHYLAYNNYGDQVLSMVDLLGQHELFVEEGTSLDFRMKLCSIHAYTDSKVKSAKNLEAVIMQLDEVLVNTPAQEKWAIYRPKLVAQLVVALLQEEVGMDNITCPVRVDSKSLASFRADTWKPKVRSTFEGFDYCTEEFDVDAGSANPDFDSEVIQLMEGLEDVQDKMRIMLIFKNWPWSDFMEHFRDFLREANDKVGGIPDLATEQRDSLSEHAQVTSPGPFPSSKRGLARPESKEEAESREDEDNERRDEIDEFEDGEEGGAVQGQGGELTVQANLRMAATNLNKTVCARADPLANALAETSPTAQSAMAGSRSNKDGAATCQKENVNERGPGRPETLIGKRHTSVSVEWHDSHDTPLDDFFEIPSLPSHSMAPLPTFVGSTTPMQQPRRDVGSKKRKRWTKEEEASIEDGVSRFGVGSWTKIKKEYFSGSSRSGVDIKDKYRNMHKDKG